ncbi:extracellular catalytic domain type 2 short-chain-length polyhydroxyalkanoate depolymerase [Rheinheimera sp. UJ63]|uniref:extracellular catalytic domain type 2 short-chain-length polyhydroxyalkanoate depolymerase n=1 Tax=Rheinheimera sp. UJ63 TaxID=2910157 RepID=UPI001F346286|nr:PHB depolymerase family esterase [Rheinheimera sp. UJ63]MCF4009724.1 polyhydroxybutyrate depolymerase [Rheinheimera sp. UJ63]
MLSCRLAVLSAMVVSTSLAASEPLPKLNLTANITVSGLSSGGYMAGQFHQAYAEEVTGVAILAAGPVNCAQGDLRIAMGHCMANPNSEPDLATIETKLNQLREAGELAPLSAVQGAKVWLFNGSADQTVSAKVGAALARQYTHWLPAAQLAVVADQPFAHHFPTAKAGLTECDKSESPFIASCQYDAAAKLLGHILTKPLKAATDPIGQLLKLDQHQLAPASQGQLAQYGYVYIPQSCAAGQRCDLHISFHGCRQDASQIGEAYLRQTGLNDYAEANQLVVLYPQVEKSTLNPFGCWDWWGYSASNYLTKNGPQNLAVKQLAAALR